MQTCIVEIVELLLGCGIQIKSRRSSDGLPLARVCESTLLLAKRSEVRFLPPAPKFMKSKSTKIDDVCRRLDGLEREFPDPVSGVGFTYRGSYYYFGLTFKFTIGKQKSWYDGPMYMYWVGPLYICKCW